MTINTNPTDAIMEQAQVFASAWSLVGGRFDSGDGHDEALAEKEELRRIVVAEITALKKAAEGESVEQYAMRMLWEDQQPEEQAHYTEIATRAFAKREKASTPPAQVVRQPWEPFLSDRADGVRGHYAICRMHPKGYREAWNLRSHQWTSASDEVLTLEEAQALLREITLRTGPGAAEGSKS